MMKTTNLIRPSVSFFVKGPLRASRSKAVRTLKLTKVPKGWIQELVDYDDDRYARAVMHVQYESDETRSQLYEWFRHDFEGQWNTYDTYEEAMAA